MNSSVTRGKKNHAVGKQGRVEGGQPARQFNPPSLGRCSGSLASEIKTITNITDPTHYEYDKEHELRREARVRQRS